jgi:hypothetical protein
MELTDDALDYPDCRPLGRETGVATPEYLQKLIDERKAKLAAAKAAAAAPPADDPSAGG